MGFRALDTGDPVQYAGLQHVQGEWAGIQDFVVEFLDVELRAKLSLGALTKFKNLQLAQLVSQRLTGPRDVAVHFRVGRGRQVETPESTTRRKAR